MARTSFDFPPLLRDEAEQWATRQGVSLDQFIVWAVAEKVGGLKHGLDDPRFPHVTYQRGAAGWPEPVVRGTAIRIQTIAGLSTSEGLVPAEIAREYDLTEEQVADALAFYEAHRGEIEASMADEREIERANA